MTTDERIAAMEEQLDRLQHAMLNTQMELQALNATVITQQKTIDLLIRDRVRKQIHGRN